MPHSLGKISKNSNSNGTKLSELMKYDEEMIFRRSRINYSSNFSPYRNGNTLHVPDQPTNEIMGASTKSGVLKNLSKQLNHIVESLSKIWIHHHKKNCTPSHFVPGQVEMERSTRKHENSKLQFQHNGQYRWVYSNFQRENIDFMGSNILL